VLRPLPPTYGDTTRSLHRLAVYVISPAQRFANDEIILRATPGGFGTFPFGDRDRVVRVDGGQLVVEEGAAEIASSPIGTIASAAQILGIDPDLAQQELFDVPPAGDIHAPLHVDPAAAEALHRWYAFAENVLEELRSDAAPQDDVTSVRLWPEHFDSAIDLGEQGAGRRATYGGSPGDRHHPEPYLYAAPWEGRIDPFFDDRGFRGRALGYDELLKADDPREAALAFLRHARALIGAR
jgi:hypothetical protein